MFEHGPLLKQSDRILRSVLLQPDNYKPVGVQIVNKFGADAGEKIPVSSISIPPLGEVLELARDENFSLFIPKHRRIAARLIDIFLGKNKLLTY